MIDPEHPKLSIERQGALASIESSSFYRTPAGETSENLALMRLIDGQFMETPLYGFDLLGLAAASSGARSSNARN